jgi:transcription elongation factor GreB
MAVKEWISQPGLEKIQDEQERLLRVERPIVVQQVADAAAEGDLSENAEYIYGKKRLREIDRRLKYLAQRVDSIRVMSPPTNDEAVQFLSVVEVENMDTDEIKKLQIVGPDESDFAQGKVSYLSPIGKAMMNKMEDDDFEFEAPGGKRYYNILSIQLP